MHTRAMEVYLMRTKYQYFKKYLKQIRPLSEKVKNLHYLNSTIHSSNEAKNSRFSVIFSLKNVTLLLGLTYTLKKLINILKY